MRRWFCCLTLFFAPCAALAEAPGSAYTGSYSLEKTHAYVMFSYLHMGFSRPWVRVNDFDASLRFDGKRPEKSRIELVLQAASLDSGVPLMDEHFADEPHFFDVAKYPVIRFQSTTIRPLGEGRYAVLGNLTVKDQTRPLRLTATLNKAAMHPFAKRRALGFSVSGQIMRSAWGMGYGVPNVSDAVELKMELEFLQDADAPAPAKPARGKPSKAK